MLGGAKVLQVSCARFALHKNMEGLSYRCVLKICFRWWCHWFHGWCRGLAVYLWPTGKLISVRGCVYTRSELNVVVLTWIPMGSNCIHVLT